MKRIAYVASILVFGTQAIELPTPDQYSYKATCEALVIEISKVKTNFEVNILNTAYSIMCNGRGFKELDNYSKLVEHSLQEEGVFSCLDFKGQVVLTKESPTNTGGFYNYPSQTFNDWVQSNFGSFTNSTSPDVSKYLYLQQNKAFKMTKEQLLLEIDKISQGPGILERPLIKTTQP
ncbi:hypothetical protein OAG1_17790 [Agarivorans sp. OAG1]|uniref:hypothetical protein n=1 Tax=Agarivorans sp. OAG1 TaxID=3082387 RepID=UPI002B284B8B|nr:hypothetical protein OAG1_17790 [Agarivorans sp. OAG1]